MTPPVSSKDRLIKRVARSLAWASYAQTSKDDYLYRARIVVDDLLSASADGKAAERALRTINAQLEREAVEP